MVRTVAKVVPEEARSLFPISTTQKLDQFFRILLQSPDPSLGFVSILLGVFEHSLTTSQEALQTVQLSLQQQQTTTSSSSGCGGGGGSRKLSAKRRASGSSGQSRRVSSFQKKESESTTPTVEAEFPPLELDLLLSLYEQFHAFVYSSVDLSKQPTTTTTSKEGSSGSTTPPPPQTSRELITTVCDALWNSLSKSYVPEKPHLQTLFTFLTASKLDAFGMATAAVAACQALRLQDVHLVLSEDHAWVTYGRDESVEVTWHGKSAEDKRGRPIVDTGAWLYLGGHPAKCDCRQMEIAALVAGLNPAVTAAADSAELVRVQQRLLWSLYDCGHLRKYPMGLATLADLEDLAPTAGRKSPGVLFEEGITSAKYYYNNVHVYPYTAYGGHLFRRRNFRDALEYWAIGAHVLSQYRFQIKEDEEMYNEFLAITKDHLPTLMKQCSQGISADSITRDPLCYARLLRLCDGVCAWEERSRTPIVHIVWAKAWISAINKFDQSIRARVIIRNRLASSASSSSMESSQPPPPATMAPDDKGAAVAAGGGSPGAPALPSLAGLTPPPPSSSSGVSRPETNSSTTASQAQLQELKTLPTRFATPTPTSPSSTAAAPLIWRKDDDGEPRVILTLFSHKMQAVGELLKANSNSSTLTLALTAQTSFDHLQQGAGGSGGTGGAKEAVGGGAAGSIAAGRTRRSTSSRFQVSGEFGSSGGGVGGGGGGGTRVGKRRRTTEEGDDPGGGRVGEEGEEGGGGGGSGEMSLPPKKRGRKIQKD